MGTPFKPKSVTNRKFRLARKKAGISSDFKFHTVRHYVATGLFRCGVEERLVMQAEVGLMLNRFDVTLMFLTSKCEMLQTKLGRFLASFEHDLG